METPFNMPILGMTAWGKTHYQLKMLQNEYMGHYGYIILICPTFSWNKSYQEWKYTSDPDFTTLECPQDLRGRYPETRGGNIQVY